MFFRSNGKPKPPFDHAAHQLKKVLAIDSTHALYPLLHDAAWRALHGKLRVSIDSLAFEIARSPALLKRWTNVHLAEDDVSAKITASLSEYFYKPKPTVPLWRELLGEN